MSILIMVIIVNIFIFLEVPVAAKVDKEKCTGCGRCYLICPQSAISSELHFSQNISQNNNDQMLFISRIDPDSSMGRGSGIIKITSII